VAVAVAVAVIAVDAAAGSVVVAHGAMER